MPKLKHKLPSYRLHKRSGQAIVTLNGTDHYLGRYDSSESRAEYERLIAEWIASRRQPVPSDHRQQAPELTVNELFLPYWEFARQHYRKNDRPTSELGLIQLALRPLLRLYGQQLAEHFGPLALKAYRQKLIDADLSRGVINQHVGRVKRFFKWGTENELVPPTVYHGLQAVVGLKRGRSPVRDTDPVRPVPDAHVEAVLRLANRQIAAMIQLQRFTGMRPGEVTIIRGCDLDTTGEIWVFAPNSHKTEHHGHERHIYLGPQAKAILKPFLQRDPNGYLFSPKEAAEEFHTKRRLKRRLPPGLAISDMFCCSAPRRSKISIS